MTTMRTTLSLRGEKLAGRGTCVASFVRLPANLKVQGSSDQIHPWTDYERAARV